MTIAAIRDTYLRKARLAILPLVTRQKGCSAVGSPKLPEPLSLRDHCMVTLGQFLVVFLHVLSATLILSKNSRVLVAKSRLKSANLG